MKRSRFNILLMDAAAIALSITAASFLLAFGTLFLSSWADRNWASVLTYIVFATAAVSAAAAYPAARWRSTGYRAYLWITVAVAGIGTTAAISAAASQ